VRAPHASRAFAFVNAFARSIAPWFFIATSSKSLAVTARFSE